MFFCTDNMSFKITTVLELGWESRNDRSGIRPHHALSYRIKGNTEFIHNNDRTRVKTGEIAFVPAFYEYTQLSSEENLIVIHFLSDDKFPKTIKYFRPENPGYFERKFKELLDSWAKKQTAYEHECKSVLYKIFTKIEREIAESKITGCHDKILEAVDYIHDNFTNNDMTVEFLAQMCNMSDTCFRKYFTEFFDVTPISYIKNLKLNYAKELIKSGYYTIQEISDKCGFNTVNYFSTFIKKETGKSPSQLRKNN